MKREITDFIEKERKSCTDHKAKKLKKDSLLYKSNSCEYKKKFINTIKKSLKIWCNFFENALKYYLEK